MNQLFTPNGDPFLVANHLTASQLHTIEEGTQFPAEVVAAIMSVPAMSDGKRRVIQMAGGCNFANPQDIADFMNGTIGSFAGVRAAFISGGTRNVQYDGAEEERGVAKAMITEIVPIICANNPGCMAIGSFPRIGVTEFINVKGQGQTMPFLRLDREYGDGVSLHYDMNVQVQEGPDGTPNDWGKDVPTRTRFLKGMEQQGAISVASLFANGGGVTKKEIGNSLNQGWLTFLMAGTGRATDGAIADLAAGTKANMPTLEVEPQWVDFRQDGFDPNANTVVVDSATLRAALLAYGVIEVQ